MAEKDSVQIKKRLSEELPEYKFSVTRNDFAGGHSVNVRVLSGPFQVFANDNERDRQNGYIEIFRDRYKEDERINDAIKPDIDKMYKIIYDIGQFPSGYHGGPYLHWNFGSYSKPYEVTASKKSASTPRPEKSSGDTKAEGELLMSFSQGWSLYKTTIYKTGTDGKPLKLVVYNLNKTKELKNIPYDKFLEFKGEMLTSLNMKWGKFQKFEKWTFPVDTDVLKVIIEKYYGVGQPKEETPTPQPTPSAEKQSFNVGDKFLMTRTGETFTIDFMVDDNYGIVYFDGLTGNLTKSALQVGLDSGYYKRVVDEEKKEYEFKKGDVFYSKLYKQKLTIDRVQEDTIFVDYEDDSSERYTPIYCRLMVQRGDWIKVIDEEKEEIPFKVGDVYKDAYSKKDLQIVKIEGDTIFFTLNGTEYNVGVIIAESYLVNKIWTKQEPKQENEEEIKKAIAALKILADDGDEDARKGIEALKILLN
jgi:hypothetical protein